MGDHGREGRNENLLRPGSSQGDQVHGTITVSVRVHSPTVIVPNQIRTLIACLVEVLCLSGRL